MHFLPKNNKVHVKLGIACQGCFFTLLPAISRAHARSNMGLFVTLLNGFQQSTKNPILDVVGVLDLSLLLYIKRFLQNNDA